MAVHGNITELLVGRPEAVDLLESLVGLQEVAQLLALLVEVELVIPVVIMGALAVLVNHAQQMRQGGLVLLSIWLVAGQVTPVGLEPLHPQQMLQPLLRGLVVESSG